MRFTLSESARREVLSRLLELNHRRYEEEVAAGLHEKKKGQQEAKRDREEDWQEYEEGRGQRRAVGVALTQITTERKMVL